MNKIDYNALGERIRDKRKELGINQSDLAKQCELSASFLGHLERGSRKASLETVVALCNILQVSPTFLLQDSLVDEAMGESRVATKTVVKEISATLMEKLTNWMEERDMQD